jgi:hypothetical protein
MVLDIHGETLVAVGDGGSVLREGLGDTYF